MTTLELNYRAELALIAIEEHTTRLAIDAYWRLGIFEPLSDLYGKLTDLEHEAAEVHLDYEMELQYGKGATAEELYYHTDCDLYPEPELLRDPSEAEFWAMHMADDNYRTEDAYADFHREEFAGLLADEIDELPF